MIHHLTRRHFLEGLAGTLACTATSKVSAGPTTPTDRVPWVGIAKVDITPDYPVRLSGFGFRRAESEGVTHSIWAKALAIEFGDQSPVVLIAVDNLGVPDEMVRALAQRLHEQAGIVPARLAVTSTHTHTAPMLTNVAPTLFGEPIPPAHQASIDRYTQELARSLEQVAFEALKDRQPSHLAWGLGSVGFAMNRREGTTGPVDHELPLLVVTSLAGDLRAVCTSYGCHCVTLSHNKIGGDWAGFAQLAMEQAYPGAAALVSIGCGADINPSSGVVGDKIEVAADQGQQIAQEVRRLVATGLQPLTGPLVARQERVELAFDTLPSREEWERRVALPRTDFVNRAIAYHAERQLARLDRGEKSPGHVSYPIQTWSFGDQMAMVFLPGEVVVDYSLRLKREFGGRQLWVNAYANDVPCYIPSERILAEGGYEGGDAMRYFNRPTRFKPGLEQQIVEVIHRQLAGWPK